ncbi:MAG: Rha family transcriptional regulator [Oscillospiraceae bacterium]|nr:Rha family transcriptional regulator [Oscillospiraceae bacterium]
MNSLSICINPNTNLPPHIDSRDVAEMTEKEHAHIMRDIRTYIGYMTGGGEPGEDQSNSGSIFLDPQDFFIEATFKDSYGRDQAMYLCTKMGCEFIAHKLTGRKGALFTAAYVRRFNQMEQTLTDYSNLSTQLQQAALMLQVMANVEMEQKRQGEALAAVNSRLDNIGDLIALNPTQWRKEVPHVISKIAQRMGGPEHIRDVYEEAYKLLDERAGSSVQTRLTNLRQRMALEGVCKSKIDRKTKVDVIAADKRLTEIFLSIIKELAIREGVTLDESEGE